LDEKYSCMRIWTHSRPTALGPRIWACGVAALAISWVGCAGWPQPNLTPNIDHVSRSGEAFVAFLNSQGKSIDEIREVMPSARADSVYLIDENVTNAELGNYIQRDASAYPFEIFLRVTVSLENRHVYRYIVKGDWRSVKMGYGALQHPELYDAIYLHTHPHNKRVIPNSLSDYIHAEAFKIPSTLLVGKGIPIEFESIGRNKDRIDHFEVDGREFSMTRPVRERLRNREQKRRKRGDADDTVRELDRIFTEQVRDGHEHVALRNSEGMLVTYDRSREVSHRLDEVYADASLLVPNGGDDFAPPTGIAQTTPSKIPRPLGF
jgi:hypothetical protein